MLEKVEDCLDPARQSQSDLDYIYGVLEEVWDAEYFHPAVEALENKWETLGAYLSGTVVIQEVLTGRADGI